MLCERCHAHPATVHMVQVVNGHRKEEHLCSECAEKEHVFQKEQSFFGHGFFDSPLDHFFGGSMLGHLLEDPFGTRTLEDQGGGQFIEVSPEKLPENEEATAASKSPSVRRSRKGRMKFPSMNRRPKKRRMLRQRARSSKPCEGSSRAASIAKTSSAPARSEIRSRRLKERNE